MRGLISIFLIIGSVSACGERSSKLSRPQVDTLQNGAIQTISSWRGEGTKGEEVVRLGGLEGEEAFGLVTGLEVSPEGHIFVLDLRSHRIQVYSGSGALVRTVGREGQGPGELLAPTALHLDRESRLWVRDQRNFRYSVFDPAGGHLFDVRAQAPMNASPWSGRVDPPAVLQDGWLRTLNLPFTHSQHTREELSRLTYHPYSHDIAKDSTSAYPGVEFMNDLAPGSRFPRPHSGKLIVLRGAAGSIWIARSDEYCLTQRRLAGDTVRVTCVRGDSPAPLSRKERDSIVRAWRGEAEFGHGDLPDTKEIIAGITRDGEGVAVFPRLQGSAEGAVLDRIGEDGSLHRVRLPVAVEMIPRPVIRNGFLYGVTLGRFDEQYVVKIAIPERPPARSTPP